MPKAIRWEIGSSNYGGTNEKGTKAPRMVGILWHNGKFQFDSNLFDSTPYLTFEYSPNLFLSVNVSLTYKIKIEVK